MSDVDSSPGDPVFFLHHGFIDRNWMQWQNADSSVRTYQIQGYTTQTEPSSGWVDTTLSYMLSAMNVIPSVELQQVMDTQGGYLCYTYNY